MLLATAILFVSCKKDDDTNDDPMEEDMTTGDKMVYDFNSVDTDGVTGTVEFAKLNDGSTQVTMMLMGLPSSDSEHPAHIHLNSAAEGGDIAITLTSVDNATGKSVTVISEMDNGTAISFEELIDFDGYINVHLSATQLDMLVAQSDIGANALTGEKMAYPLSEKDIDGIMGEAIFHERKDGSSLIEVMLEGDAVTGEHPMHIHENSAVESGDIYITLTSVDAEGMSWTHVDAGMITYDDLIMYDGYINVHSSADDLGTLVAQGDIGGNVLTGTEKVYNLMEKDVAGVMGTATFKERKNGNTLLEVALTGTTDGVMSPAHIHVNDAATTGDIAITISPIDGTTGMSSTNIEKQDDSSLISYSQLLSFDGYINVHKSTTDLVTLIAQGNIGSNVN